MNLIPIEMEDYKLQLALIELKEELKDFMTNLVETSTEEVEENPWLKTKGVCALLSCSPATVGRLRTDGTLKYSLVQKTYYHRQSDVELMMKNGRVN